MVKKADPFIQPDKLGSELTVRAGIDKTGTSLKAKSRAVTALDRLIGSALDIPGIWLERRSERARLITATEQEAI